jgi:hypothetical protein
LFNPNWERFIASRDSFQVEIAQNKKPDTWGVDAMEVSGAARDNE